MLRLSLFSMQTVSTWCLRLLGYFSAAFLLTCSLSEQPVCMTALQKNGKQETASKARATVKMRLDRQSSSAVPRHSSWTPPRWPALAAGLAAVAQQQVSAWLRTRRLLFCLRLSSRSISNKAVCVLLLMFKVVWNMVARRKILKFQQILRKINRCNYRQMNSFYSSTVTNILRCLRTLCAFRCRSSWSITTRTCTPTTPRRSRVLTASLWSPSSLRSVPVQRGETIWKQKKRFEPFLPFSWTASLSPRPPQAGAANSSGVVCKIEHSVFGLSHKSEHQARQGRGLLPKLSPTTRVSSRLYPPPFCKFSHSAHCSDL